ncbi:MAG: transcription elongation factor GreA [Proteobacteria bacterium]|nr:transcription elongation factor GreA [Pseudomonadota bacterium]
MDKKPISRAGFDVLATELRQLQETERPAILIAVAEARAHGDLSENADYSAAREKQRSIDKRIRFLEETIANAHVIDVSELSGDKITFGAHVVAEDEDGNKLSCQLLSDTESDGRAVISCTSPTGRAMIGKCVGDTCIVRTPGGEKEYEILEVKFKI